MKAVVCSELGGPDRLSLEDVDPPIAGEGQVVVDIKAASVNFPDLLTIRGMYQIKAEPPFVPGFESAGVVSAIGPGVSTLAVGDRVAAFGTFGAFAERWAVDATNCIPLPDDVSFEAGAAITVAYGTSYHALKQRARLQQGETLLVLGAAGGVGAAAVELGANMGARVIAAASSDEKLAFCRELGATETVNYTTDDLRQRIKEVTEGKGVDIVYDPVGGNLAEAAFRSIAWNGRYLVIGFAAGDIPALPFNLPLLKGASIVGVFWGSFLQHEPQANEENVQELFDLVTSGTITPRVTDTFPLASFRDAYRVIEDRTATGKILLIP